MIKENEKKGLYHHSMATLKYLIPTNITFVVCKPAYLMKDLYYQGRKRFAYMQIVVSFMKLLIRDMIEGKMIKTNNISTLYFYIRDVKAKKYKTLIKNYGDTVWLKDLDLIANGFNMADFVVKTSVDYRRKYYRIDVQKPDRRKLIAKLNAGKRYFTE